MTNTISLQTSKRLTPYLEEVDTEFHICWNEEYWPYTENDMEYLTRNNAPVLEFWIFKTLTLEEAIEFLPEFQIEKYVYEDENWKIKLNAYQTSCWMYTWNKSKTLLEAVENMLIYLLDNDLLWTNIDKQ